MEAMGAAAWMESLRGLCAWNVWRDLSCQLATAGMHHLRALARLDSRYIAEVAAVAPGLLAAAQIRRRRERQQQQQQEYQQQTSRLWLFRRRPKPRLLSWQEGVFWTFVLAFGGVVFIHVGRRVLAGPSLAGAEEASDRVSRPEDGVPLSENLMVAVIVAAACYAVTGFSCCRRLLDHWSVRTPLGIAAELLRAYHVSAAAAIALALVPPLLSVAVSEKDPVSQEDAAFSSVVVGFLGLLRLLSSVVAGASVSCVGGGSWACSVRRRPPPEAQRLRRSIIYPGKSMTSLPEGRGAINGGRRRIDADRARGNSGVEGIGGVHELRREGEDMGKALFWPWFVPSGALGGAFYAIAAGGVFGGVLREFFFGNDWFASPEFVRLTLAILYAVVFTLRSILEISEASGVDVGVGSASAPLRALSRLLESKASSKNLAQGTSGVGISGQRLALSGAARPETWQLADDVTSGRSRSPRRAISPAKHSGAQNFWLSLISWARGQNRAESAAVKPSDAPREEAVDGDRAGGDLYGRCAVGSGSGATAIAALDGVQQQQQPNGETRTRGHPTVTAPPSSFSKLKKSQGFGAGILDPNNLDGVDTTPTAAASAGDAAFPPPETVQNDCLGRSEAAGPSDAAPPQRAGWRPPVPVGSGGGESLASPSVPRATSLIADDLGFRDLSAEAGGEGVGRPGGDTAFYSDISRAVGGGDRAPATGVSRAGWGGGVDAAVNAAKAVVGAVTADAVEDGRSARLGGGKEDGNDRRRGRRPRSRRSVSEVVGTRTRIETGYGGAVGAGVGFSDVGRGCGKSGRRGGGGGGRFSRWLESLETWAFPSVLLIFLIRQVTLAAKRRYWADKGFDALISSFRKAFFDGVGSALLLRFPRGAGAGIFVAALMAAARVRNAAEKVDPADGLPCITHGSALTYVGAFGGDILASACLGSRAMVLTEEGAVPSAVFTWMLVGGRLWGRPGRFSLGLRGFLSFAGVHHALVVLAEAFRALLVCRAVDSAKRLSEGGVEGGSWTLAVVAGILAGCGGIFLPGDRGLSPLSKEAPWTLQSAAYGSAFYYFADSTTLSAQAQAQAAVAVCFSVVAIARTSRRLGPAFNPFSPIHRAACRLLGVKVSQPAARAQTFSRLQSPAAVRGPAAAAEAGPLAAVKGRISSANLNASRSRIRSCSPTPEQSVATAAAVAAATAAAGPCPQRSLSLCSSHVRVGTSKNNTGVRTEAAAAKVVAALPAEQLGFRGHAIRRRFSGAVPDGREGFELGSARTRALSTCSRTRRGAHSHADGGTGELRASARRDRHHRGRPVSESFIRRSRGTSDVLTRGPARRGRPRLEGEGETEAGRRREAGLWVDGDGLGARGVGRAVAWAAVAASLIAFGRWLALTAQPSTVHSPSPHGQERVMLEPGRMTPSGLLVLLVLLQARSDPRCNLSLFDGDGDGATSWSSHLGRSGGGADVVEKSRGSPFSSSTRLSYSAFDDCSEAVVGEFSENDYEWMGEVAEGQDLDASVAVIDSCGHGPTTPVAQPPSPPAQADETPLKSRSLNSSVDGRSIVAAGKDQIVQAMATATERKTVDGASSLDHRQPESTPFPAWAPDAEVIAFDVAVDLECLADGASMNSPEEMENYASPRGNWFRAKRSGGGYSDGEGVALRDASRKTEQGNLPPVREGSALGEGDGRRDGWNSDDVHDEDASRVGVGDQKEDCGGDEDGDSDGDLGRGLEGKPAVSGANLVDDVTVVKGCTAGLDGIVALGTSGVEGGQVEEMDTAIAFSEVVPDFKILTDESSRRSAGCASGVVGCTEGDTARIGGSVETTGGCGSASLSSSDGARSDQGDTFTVGVDSVDAGAELDGADRGEMDGDALARGASASSDAAAAEVAAIADGVVAIDGVATDSIKPIRKSHAIDNAHAETADAAPHDGYGTRCARQTNVLGTPSCRVDEGGREIGDVTFETVADSVLVAGRDGDRTAAVGVCAAGCDTGHVIVGKECIDERSPVAKENAATGGEPQDGSEGGTGEGMGKLCGATESIICVDGSGDTINGDDISSENRACEDSDGVRLEATALPARFMDALLPSSHAPKFRPWGLPGRAPPRSPADSPSIAPIFKYITPGSGDFLRGFSDAPPPLDAALVGAVDTLPPLWVRPADTSLPPGNDEKGARPLLPKTASEHALGTGDLGNVQDEEGSLMKEMIWNEKDDGGDTHTAAEEMYPDEAAKSQPGVVGDNEAAGVAAVGVCADADENTCRNNLLPWVTLVPDENFAAVWEELNAHPLIAPSLTGGDVSRGGIGEPADGDPSSEMANSGSLRLDDAAAVDEPPEDNIDELNRSTRESVSSTPADQGLDISGRRADGENPDGSIALVEGHGPWGGKSSAGTDTNGSPERSNAVDGSAHDLSQQGTKHDGLGGHPGAERTDSLSSTPQQRPSVSPNHRAGATAVADGRGWDKSFPELEVEKCSGLPAEPLPPVCPLRESEPIAAGAVGESGAGELVMTDAAFLPVPCDSDALEAGENGIDSVADNLTAGLGVEEEGEGSCEAAALTGVWSGTSDRWRDRANPVACGSVESSGLPPEVSMKRAGGDLTGRGEDETEDLAPPPADAAESGTASPTRGDCSETKATLLSTLVESVTEEMMTSEPDADAVATGFSSWSGGKGETDEVIVAVMARGVSNRREAGAPVEMEAGDDGEENPPAPSPSPEEVFPVLEGILAVDSDARESGHEVVIGSTRLPNSIPPPPPPPPAGANKRPAGSAVKKTVALVAIAVYYGAWAAITLALG